MEFGQTAHLRGMHIKKRSFNSMVVVELISPSIYLNGQVHEVKYQNSQNSIMGYCFGRFFLQFKIKITSGLHMFCAACRIVEKIKTCRVREFQSPLFTYVCRIHLNMCFYFKYTSTTTVSSAFYQTNVPLLT